MQNFSLNSKVYYDSKEYQIRTSNNGQLNKVICSLFRDGDFINSKEISYKDVKDNAELLSLTKKFHNERKTEIELFFHLSQKLSENGSAELLNMLGLILDKYNLHYEAVKEFLKALEKQPTYSWIYNNLGKSLTAIKRYDQAMKAFQNAIRITPNYADFYNNLGKVYLDNGSCSQAAQQFDKAIELNSYYAEAYFNKGMTYIANQILREDFKLTTNYKTEAIACFERACLMNPSYQNSAYTEALSLVDKQDMKAALDKMKIARDQGTQLTYIHIKYEYFLKILFCEQDESYDTILEYVNFLKELIENYPGHADLYNDLGLAYSMLRNYINEKAIESFESALKINPKFEQAKRNLKLSNYEKVGSELFLKAITFSERVKEPKKLPEKQKKLVISENKKDLWYDAETEKF
ncbi:tetratricopeptide repeat protein [candidate division KSB1 bacterium]|nr:tetratricopeptide repeat protein [candidate division KSB1 bacterium]